MSLSIGVNPFYKNVLGGKSGAGSAIGVSGSWKSVKGIWIGSGGSWKRCFGFDTTMTRGTNGGSGDGAARGYSLNGPIGSLSDDAYLEGQQIYEIRTYEFSGQVSLQFKLFHATEVVAQDFFTSLECSLGTFQTASADVFSDVVFSAWIWYVGSHFASSGTEEVLIF